MNAKSEPRLERSFWLAVLVAHAMAAAAWFWLRPGGFPWEHPRFWFDRVLPVLGLAWTLASLFALHRLRDDLLVRSLPAYPAAWAGGALASRLCFPITFGLLWLVPLVVALLMGLVMVRLNLRGGGRRSLRLALLTAAAAATLGALTVRSLRPDPPGTRPCGDPASEDIAESAPGKPSTGISTGLMQLSPRTAVYASEGSIIAGLGTLKVEVHPLLRFLSLSPDGCWVVFNRASEREGPEPRITAVRDVVGEPRRLSYRFPGVGSARLDVGIEEGSRKVRIEADSTIDRDVYSHLNSFCDVEVRGHRRLSLGFSPCDRARIEVLPFGYPAGHPLRFAFVDATRRFIVAEAASGEKGPFRTLAEGPLAPGDPLTITLYDEDRESGHLTLRDWSAQLDTRLSPTAGWGVPANAIEFSLSSADPSSPASIFVTLAATSVGRGWDCVGHAAGTYRSRVEIAP